MNDERLRGVLEQTKRALILCIFLSVAGCATSPTGEGRVMPLTALREADQKFNRWLDQRLGFESEEEAARRRRALP